MTRGSTGRFVVRLPFRENKKFGESKQIAIRRLKHLERKFRCDQEFYNQYSKFMQEYSQLNHMSKIV